MQGGSKKDDTQKKDDGKQVEARPGLLGIVQLLSLASPRILSKVLTRPQMQARTPPTLTPRLSSCGHEPHTRRRTGSGAKQTEIQAAAELAQKTRTRGYPTGSQRYQRLLDRRVGVDSGQHEPERIQLALGAGRLALRIGSRQQRDLEPRTIRRGSRIARRTPSVARRRGRRGSSD